VVDLVHVGFCTTVDIGSGSTLAVGEGAAGGRYAGVL
jgi:hypothetical protein